jgi:2'-5' RNA ligase
MGFKQIVKKFFGQPVRLPEATDDSPSAIASLIFDTDVHSGVQSVDWAEAHGFNPRGVVMKAGNFHFPQMAPGTYEPVRTVDLAPGVRAVVGKRVLIEKKGSGVMVALYLPPDVALRIAETGGELPSDLHVTLAYVKTTSPEAVARIADIVQKWSSFWAPPYAKIGGYGCFNASPESDGKTVWYASFDSPGLVGLVANLHNVLTDEGFEPANAHGFTPHVTLAYDKALSTPSKSSDMFECSAVSVVCGDQRYDIPFEGKVTSPVYKSQPTSSDVHVPVAGSEKKKPPAPTPPKPGAARANYVLRGVELDPNPPINNQEVEVDKDALTTDERNDLHDKTFALPDERKYPIPDLAHARNALARVAQHGTADEQKKVRAAVYRKFPDLKKTEKAAHSFGNDGGELYDMQQMVDGLDQEWDGGEESQDDALSRVISNLADDPDHYLKQRLAADWSDDKLADHDAGSVFKAAGLKIHAGTFGDRNPGHVGLDTYAHDYGTIVHDVGMGLPFRDGSASQVYVNHMHELALSPSEITNEAARVLKPGGQFVHEGPVPIDINHPDLVETDYVEKDADDPGVKQTFTKVVPDAATSNDAEPRLGVSQEDMLPSDALLAMDAMSFAWSDATTSGPGNRLHGYASQGALVKKRRANRRQIEKALKGGKECVIVRKEAMKQIVYGVVLSPDEFDSQGDIMSAEEIMKTAHKYIADVRVGGAQHKQKINAYPVESYLAPQDLEFPDEGYGPQTVKKGAWVLGMKVEDPDEWEKVCDGEYQSFSIGGIGDRSPVVTA